MRPVPAWPNRPGVAADHGGIVLGWLTKVTVALALVGIVLFDAISIGSTMATVTDQGSIAAREASATWNETKDVQTTFDTAVRSATEQDPGNLVTPTGFSIDADGTVHLTIRREARTLVLFRWERTRPWAVVKASTEGRSVG